METLAELYLSEQDGNETYVSNYHHYLAQGHRIGQAFFNALPAHDQNRLTGTLADPFYKNDSAAIITAVEFLTRP